jgi:hypothetical protein
MPTTLIDRTSDRKGEIWDNFLAVCMLKSAFSGRVCFSAGAEFGCGDELEVGVEKEKSLEAKIGAEKEGIGVDLTIGTKTTRSEKWTVKSKDCQWCKPEICFPDSVVETWSCSTLLSLYIHNYDKTYFYPGKVTERVNNCGPDIAGYCGCKEVVVTPPAVRDQINARVATWAMPAVIIKPISFVRENQVYPSQTFSDYAKNYENSLATPRLPGDTHAIGVKNEAESINWLYPPNGSQRLSLLSQEFNESRTRNGVAPFRGRFLPLLAATQFTPQATASVTVTVNGQHRPTETMEVMSSGLFTLIWGEIDFGTPLKKNTELSIDLRLSGPDQRVLASLSRSYVVLLD